MPPTEMKEAFTQVVICKAFFCLVGFLLTVYVTRKNGESFVNSSLEVAFHSTQKC